MSRPAERVVLVTLIAVGLLVVLYPRVRPGELAVPGVLVRPMPPSGPRMPTYRPTPETAEQMPVLRPGWERAGSPRALDSLRRGHVARP